MLTFLAATGFSAALAMEGFRRRESRHTATLDTLDVNVHVNGIRGKSTVTRMIGGMLRAQGFTTIAKTTGTYACVIDHEGTEHPISVSARPTSTSSTTSSSSGWPRAPTPRCLSVWPSNPSTRLSART